jgi:hypothetical protein
MIKEIIVSQIRETVQSRNYRMEKAQLTEQDSRILDLFQLKNWYNNLTVECNPQLQIGARN